jgi:hypothetical protein
LIVDCAQNLDLAKDLSKFLSDMGFSVKLSKDLVVSERKISQNILQLFLIETTRSKHKVIPFDSDSFVLAIPKTLEDIGLESCEFCGYTAHNELVAVHRRSHQGF